jgi:hypothetical protein
MGYGPPCQDCGNGRKLWGNYTGICDRHYQRRLRARRAAERAERPDKACVCCSKAFRGRADAKFCSNACRQKAYRNSVTLKIAA